MVDQSAVETSSLTRREIWSRIDELVKLGVTVTRATEQFNLHRDSYYKREKRRQKKSEIKKPASANTGSSHSEESKSVPSDIIADSSPTKKEKKN